MFLRCLDFVLVVFVCLLLLCIGFFFCCLHSDSSKNDIFENVWSTETFGMVGIVL